MTTQKPTDEAMTRQLEEASAFRVRLAEAGMDSSEALEAWLAADPAHRAAWARVNGPWELVGEHATAPELMAMRRDALSRTHRQGRARWNGRPRRGRLMAAVASFAVIVACGIGVYMWNAQRGDVYRTVSGERRVVTLEDGSKISLDARSEVRVRYTGDARRLELLSGQARFDVAHDSQRPFSVRARDQLVIATGTAFNVDMVGSTVLVTLIEGRVEVLENIGTPRPRVAAHLEADDIAVDKPQRQVLTAGEQLRVAPDTVPVVTTVDVDRAVAWESGHLVFSDEPLSSVVARINRYAALPVEVDPDIGKLRISGVFRTDDLGTFIDTVTRYLPVVATVRDDGGVTLHHKG
jgi:transmembrane sensor